MTSPLTNPISVEEGQTSRGDAQAIIDAAERAAGFHALGDGGRFHAALTPDGKVHVVDLEDHLDDHRDRPRRKVGAYKVHDVASFTHYLEKHALEETEVWADVINARIVAVINAHTNSLNLNEDKHLAGWGDHRLSYEVALTEGWKAWTAHDGKLLDQAAFAEHIENRAIDIVAPPAADMLELAQTFQATIGVSFESSKRLSNGERQLEYREEVSAQAGRKGQFQIPKQFTLALTPFEGAEAYKVIARFRYRITDGNLRIGYTLERPNDILRSAFLDVANAIDDAIDAPVFRGVSA